MGIYLICGRDGRNWGNVDIEDIISREVDVEWMRKRYPHKIVLKLYEEDINRIEGIKNDDK